MHFSLLNEQERLVAEQAVLTLRALGEAADKAEHGRGMEALEAVVHDKGMEHLRAMLCAAVNARPGAQNRGVRRTLCVRGRQQVQRPVAADAPEQCGAGQRRPTEFSVLVHELAHEMLHRGERRQQVGKTVRGAVTFVMCRAIGLDTGTAASDYIQLYSGDRQTLAESLMNDRAVASAIIAAIQPAD